jgi:hypothetical protein
MDIFEQIANDPGEMIHNFDESHRNVFICTGYQMRHAKAKGFERYVGRLEQVRLEHGQFGSDLVFILHHDGVTWTHENQSFYLVKKKYIPELSEMYKDFDVVPDTEAWTSKGENPEYGFIIPSKIPEGETTPLREVKSDIYKTLDDIFGS